MNNDGQIVDKKSAVVQETQLGIDFNEKKLEQ